MNSCACRDVDVPFGIHWTEHPGSVILLLEQHVGWRSTVISCFCARCVVMMTTATLVFLAVGGCVPASLDITSPQSTPTLDSLLDPLTSVPAVESMTITVLYDNYPYDSNLKTDWGFSCLIECGEAAVLFDTGANGSLLLDNMDAMGIDPLAIDLVVLSHIHRDHVGGLESLLSTGVRPTVYVPRAFPAGFKRDVRSHVELIEVHDALEIVDGVYTTGEMGSRIVEQALILETHEGLIVITGCAHPGVTEVVRRAREISQHDIYLVMGGFHLGGASDAQVEEIISEFRRLGVKKVAPCHCTGNGAIELFREAYGEDFIQAGVGRVLEIPL